ncbi:TRAP transporter small permease [Bordetella bronchiseptica]|uniref:TRAP transporter small permease n=1 Tax=Bordetella bronchiseptica TaxID=518 RepID=UPI00029062F4|nr:TRAP transporter small permease [Bordetella bronchiseptica]AWP80273.1 C4-dicarboxylate ABC transporter permease [Bordetella bronchiseptica]KAB1446231.1 TRAP transporter small permease [Bordetella bronchiseptica]KAB1572679.1 TRAP transporter small permease [Bordetella bronchiseptica]KDB63902.1 TRAP transporter, DctQ-like membrane protein [Bordetella bronchiseptica B18-5 (C3)]KDC41253.1 TRAP transporter, DctQ-like membrane protein [Bordetella bronchiseptica M435/02/3]
MKSLLDRLTRIGHGTNRAAVFIAQAALLLMMLLTVYSVIARYVLQRPSVHAVEISIYLLLLVTWLSVGWTHLLERHVSMEMLSIRVRGRGKRLLNVFRELVVLVFCGFLLHAGVQIAATALARNYRSTSLLAFPMWIAYGLIAVGALLLAIAAACKLNHPDGNAAIAPPSPEA